MSTSVTSAAAQPRGALLFDHARYDGFGNRLQQNVTKGTAPSTVQTVDPLTNRLNGAGFGYDSNGNMTGWSTPSGSVTASYDVENRMTQIVTPSVTETYKYGPGNLRVKKYQGGAWTYTVYGQGGEVLGTYSVCTVSSSPFLCEAKLRVYFGGRLVLSGWSGVTADRLGSPQGVHGRVYPYGEVSGSVPVDQEETFTTYKRDVYTGLDYAQNRYYASSWGRFTTADPYRASGGPANPGSWNRYAYVNNDPVNHVDPKGLQAMAPGYVCPYYDDPEAWLTCYFVDPNPGGGPGAGPSPAPPPESPDPVPADPNYVNNQIVAGVRAQSSSLLRSNTDCAGLFGAFSDSAAQFMDQVPIVLISSAAVPDAKPGVGGFTTQDSGGAIFLFTNRYFFTNLLEDGTPATSAPVFSGLSMNEMQQTILIHELLHWIGVVGADSDNQQITLPSGETVSGSAGVTMAVKSHCFGK